MFTRKRILRLLLALPALLTVGLAPADAAVEDPFHGAAAQHDGPHEREATVDLGDWGVAEQRGAVTYTYRIAVPPGRHGLEPKLALRYSSRSPLRGGIAAGWTLDVPSITVDRSLGAGGETRYRASLGGASGRLVEVPETLPSGWKAFRVELDGSFTRFLKLPSKLDTSTWTALTPDGVKHHFAPASAFGDGRTRWLIARQVDAHGNTVSYSWTTTASGPYVEYDLARVEYTSNAGAGLEPHAKVELSYGPAEACAGSRRPVGAAPAVTPLLLEGGRPLTAVTTSVRDGSGEAWRVARRVELEHHRMSSRLHLEIEDKNLAAAPAALACTYAPLRFLTGIRETGYDGDGDATTVPPTAFTYNRRLFDPRYAGPAPFSSRTIASPGFGEHGDLHGAGGTLLDLDGDGVLDRATVVEEASACVLLWRKGIRGGAFETTPRRSPLPTARWSDDPELLNPSDGRVPAERCTLSGQVTTRLRPVEVEGHIGWEHAKGVLGYHFLDWTGDGRLDLVTAVWASVDHASYVPGSTATGPRADPDSAPGMTPEKREGRYVVRVYRNTADAWAGNPPGGVFSTQPLRVDFPRTYDDECRPDPLPPPARDNALNADVLPDVSIPSLTDIDGDGFLDLVDMGKSVHALGLDGTWCVWLGRGHTEFTSAVWRGPQLSLANERGYTQTVVDEGGTSHVRRTTIAALRDADGDGRTDLLVQGADGELRAYLNTGTQFRTEPLLLGVQAPVEIVQTDLRGAVAGQLVGGARGYLLRLVDVDGDGLLDQLSTPTADGDVTEAGVTRVRFGDGERFQPSVRLPDRWAEARRLLHYDGGRWHLESDFFDIDGDGAADLARWSTDGRSVTIATRPGLPAAADLLDSVERDTGLELSFGYGLTSDPAIVEATFGIPHAHWVASSTTVSAGFDTPAQTTRYTYASPLLASPGLPGAETEAKRLLGMGLVRRDVVVDGRVARRTTRSYAYGSTGAPDGRVVVERLYRQDGERLVLHRETRNVWQRKDLFGGLAQFAPRLSSVTRNCVPGASDAECAEQDENVSHVEETWLPRACAGAPYALYVRKSRSEGLAAGAEERRTQSWHTIRCDQATLEYRVLVDLTQFEEGSAVAGFELRGATRLTHDAAGLPVRTEEFHDASTVATTIRSFDPETGNLIGLTKPEQAAAGAAEKRTTFAYDENGLYVAKTVNELGYQVLTSFDPATGKPLQRRGPNAVVLPGGEKAWERETWRYDGVGREVAHAVSFDDAAAGYVVETVSKTAYLDAQQPRRVRTERLRDAGGTVWMIAERAVDGLGRRLTETEYAASGAPVTTTYSYGGHGNVSAIDVPDPRADGSHVRYAYGYDGLGRLVSLTRPDGTGLAVTHAGLTKTLAEVTVDGSGSTRREVYDALGRLVRVHELQPGADAITRYTYDGDDRVTRVTDADGNVSTIAYDWSGRRVRVARGQRIWRYAYDLNGNLVGETRPGGATATHTYDDLDRVTADVAGAETVSYAYDDGANGVGRLSRVTLPFGEVRYAYEARGLVAREERSVSLAELERLEVTQWVERSYNALGQMVRSSWDDGQRWRLTYDTRGLTRSVEWYDSAAAAWQKAAELERSHAGQPRTRRSSYSQVRRYDYDALGRVAGDQIAVATGLPIATRSYDFTDAGDVKAVSGHTDGVSAAAGYTYDARHRLTTASGPRGYAGSFTYSDAGNVLTAAVTWNGSTESRNVRYEYSATDPQAVERLVDNSGGAGYARFAYDEAGNMTARTTPEGQTRLQWDGRNRIRVAETPAGRETFLYDHTGARMLAIGDRETRLWFGESETAFDRTGKQTRRYLHLSDGGSTVARITDGATIELQYADALQNLMLSLDEQGNVAAAFHYGPYGEVLRGPGQKDHRRQFNGKETDQLTGLRYYGHRYYDPLALRWASADPRYRAAPDLALTDPRRQNLYAFSLDNPVRYYDPDGLDSDDTDEGEGEICEAPRDAESTCDVADETSEPAEEAAAEETVEESQTTEEEASAEIVSGPPPPGGFLGWLSQLIVKIKLLRALGGGMTGRDGVTVHEDGRHDRKPRKEVVQKRTTKPTSPKPSTPKPRPPRLKGKLGPASFIIDGIINESGLIFRAIQNDRTPWEQFEEETKHEEKLQLLPGLWVDNLSHVPEA
jgi:RHS repeat-associated protein